MAVTALDGLYMIIWLDAIHYKVTKGAFTSDNALLKPVYLVVQNISEKWTMPLHSWNLTLLQWTCNKKVDKWLSCDNLFV